MTKEGKTFKLGEGELKTIQKLKSIIKEDAELKYFEAKKAVTIECDASYSGIGAVMMQEGRPVNFASRTLTETEKKYHPMELECLSVLFACSKFDQYIYGKKDVKILSDHQPTAEQNQNKVQVFYSSIDDTDPTLYTDFKDSRLEILRRHNAEDETIKRLIDMIKKGWPVK